MSQREKSKQSNTHHGSIVLKYSKTDKTFIVFQSSEIRNEKWKSSLTPRLHFPMWILPCVRLQRPMTERRTPAYPAFHIGSIRYGTRMLETLQ